MTVHEKINLTVKDLMSCRGDFTPPKLREMTSKLEQYIESCGAKKVGMPITATYASNKALETTDVQIFIPIDKEIATFQDFVFMSELHVENCLMTKHKGNPQLVPVAYEAMITKAKNLGYKIKKPAYNVIIVEPSPTNMSDFEMDIYLPLDI